MFVRLVLHTNLLLHEWTNERTSKWMNKCILWIFKSAFNSELGMSKQHITPNTHPETPTLTNQDSLRVPACQVHFITRSFGSCQHVLARFIQRKKGVEGGWKNATLPFSSANLFTETILCQWSANCLKSGLKRPCSSDVCAYMNISVCYYLQVIHILMCYIKPGIACQKKTPTRFCFMEKMANEQVINVC